MSTKVSINMVAKRADVSRGTVDRVLNQRPHVKPDVYDRVVRAMKDLGYIPPREEQAQALGLMVSPTKPCRLGVLLPNWHGFFKSEIMRGIADAETLLKDYSVKILVEKCETDLPEENMERLDHLLAQQVHGIAICIKDHSSIIKKIEELHAQGIPVVTFNSDLPGSKRLCFVGQDLVRGGRVAGELMSKYLRPDDNLLVAIGNPEFQAHRLRLQGFCERLYECGFHSGHLKMIETYNDYALTYQKVSEILMQTSDIKGIYMANDSITGCVDAVRSSGQQNIHIISHDVTDATKKLLQQGDIDFAIAQDLYRQGYRPLMILREYLQLQTMSALDADRPAIQIICAENIHV